jgi:hypothetical protein
MVILIFLLLALLAGAADPKATPFASTSQRRANTTQKTRTSDRQRGHTAALP